MVSIPYRYREMVGTLFQKNRDSVQRLFKELSTCTLFRPLAFVGRAPEIRKLARIFVVLDERFPSQQKIQKVVRRP